jgi:DNA excision repair protein ERCC-2
LDPKIAPLVTKSFDKNSILVFDEAHNIDNVCIEVLSVNIDNHVIRNSQQNLKRLEEIIATMKRTNAKRLTDEYQRLVSGLATAGIGQRSTTEIDYSIPVLDDKIMKEAVPGNIRKAEHFVGFLRRFIQYVSLRLKDVDKVIQEMPRTFLNALHYKTTIDARTLAFCAERLISLMNTLEIKDIHEFNAIKVITDFATLVGSYEDGFTIIIEPHDERTPTIPEPILQFSCMDASIAISKPIFDRFNTVVLTSGTLSPLDKYSKLLQFSPTVSRSLPMSLTRECICPLVLTRGSDQVAVSTKYQMRNDPAVVRNYGSLLVELSRYVPDGIICFFTSYQYMEDVVMMWNQMELLDTITQHKLVFIETPNTAETSIALTNYRRACDSGRGAVFLSIARGKVAEGVDFDGHYGRAVVMFGIPFVNTESKILKARLDYLKKNYGIQEGDFLTFDALRHASQCIGRVIRNKSDYGLMILADKRYNQPDKRNKLPEWISRRIENQNLNLSTDTLIGECRKFLKQMAQPWSAKQLLLTQKDVERIATRKKAQQDKTNGTEVEDSNSRKRKFDEVQ